MPSYLIACTIRGAGNMRVRNRTYSVAPGQALFIDCMEHHCFETDPEQRWEFMWVRFNGPLCKGYYDLMRERGGLVFDTGRDSAIPPIISRMMDLQRRGDSTAELHTSKLLLDLMTEALQCAMPEAALGNAKPVWVTDLMRLLDRRFKEKLTLDDMAAHCAMNKFQLCKDFKKHTGLTPNEYVIRNRIRYAKRLLAQTDLSVEQIAHAAGIENASHFINLFKAREKMTPLAYRKKGKSGL